MSQILPFFLVLARFVESLSFQSSYNENQEEIRRMILSLLDVYMTYDHDVWFNLIL